MNKLANTIADIEQDLIIEAMNILELPLGEAIERLHIVHQHHPDKAGHNYFVCDKLHATVLASRYIRIDDFIHGGDM